RLVEDSQAVVRYQAAVALTRYGDQAKPVINSLVRGCDDLSAWEIRRVAVNALSLAGRVENGPADVRAVRAMYSRLSDQAFQVRLEAIMGLGYMGKCADAVLQTAVEQKLQLMTADRDKVTVIWAYVALMSLEKPADPIVSAIVRHLKAPEF